MYHKVKQILRDVKGPPSGGWALFLSLAVFVALSLMASQCATPPTPEAVVTQVVEPEVEEVVEPEVEAVEESACVDSGQELVCRFEEEGVTVTVPWQGKGVEVVKLPLGTLEGLRSDDDDFSPTRLVINFEVRDADTGETLDTFNPSIELEVAYTAEDVDYAGGLENLVLGFWDDTRWVAFTEEKHGFRLEGDSEGGVGFATVPSWDDRRIACGGR